MAKSFRMCDFKNSYSMASNGGRRSMPAGNAGDLEFVSNFAALHLILLGKLYFAVREHGENPGSLMTRLKLVIPAPHKTAKGGDGSHLLSKLGVNANLCRFAVIADPTKTRAAAQRVSVTGHSVCTGREMARRSQWVIALGGSPKSRNSKG